MSNQVTFSDIASYTGFSKTTISRYFNKPDTVTEKHRETIRKALEVLGYQENKLAQILAKGKTDFIGIIMPNLYLNYFSEMLDHILNTYEEFGFKYIVLTGSEDPETEQRYIRELLAYQIEGLIVMNHTLASRELAEFGVPVVTIEREDQWVNSVNCDNYMGAIQAVSLLAKKNCDVLIHLNSPTHPSLPSYKRITGFLDFCREHEIPRELMIREIGASHEAVYAPVKDAFEAMEALYPDKRKGVFCSNDVTANYLLNLVIRKYRGLTPLYRIVGFDNSPVSEAAVYPISTVGQQIDVIAREAVQLLADKIRLKRSGDPEANTLVHKVITPVLCRRETTEDPSTD